MKKNFSVQSITQWKPARATPMNIHTATLTRAPKKNSELHPYLARDWHFIEMTEAGMPVARASEEITNSVNSALQDASSKCEGVARCQYCQRALKFSGRAKSENSFERRHLSISYHRARTCR